MPMKNVRSFVANGSGPTEKDGRYTKSDPRVLFKENFLINLLELDTSKTTILSKEEERELIEKYRHDRKKLNQELVLHNTRAACSIAKRYAVTTEDFDDLIARAMCGLVVAADKFDIDSGNRFLTYATNWIFNWIQREYYSRGRKIFNDTTISITKSDWDSEDEIDPENSLIHMLSEVNKEKYIGASVEKTIQESEMLDIVADIASVVQDTSKFSDLDRAIFNEKLLRDSVKGGGRGKTKSITFQELSAQFNVSVPDVKKRRDGLCQKLREYISDKYEIDNVGDIFG